MQQNHVDTLVSIDGSSSDQELADLVERITRELENEGSVDIATILHEHPQHAARLEKLLPPMQALMNWRDDPLGPSSRDQDVPDRRRPRTLGDFQIIREVGRGGMGVVYEAEQLSMGRRVALKVLPFAAIADGRSLQRFRNEVRAAAALDHPHIVSVYSLSEERGVHFYAMQFIRGCTLAELIHQLKSESTSVVRTGREWTKDLADAETSAADDQATERRRSVGHADFRRAARLAMQAADALQHAHDQGVLHRDIKPSNLLVDGEGNLYITDFGLARIEADASVTVTGDVVGTLRYMAPEQALGKRKVVDERADVYSLGATLYELLTLNAAFAEVERSALLAHIAQEEPVSIRKLNRRIPRELELIVEKAMAKLPEDRYQSARLFADDLRAFVEHRPLHARPATLDERLRKWSRRHRSLVRAAVVALATATVALAIGLGYLRRAQLRTLTALEDTSQLLYVADIAAAYDSFSKGWTDEASAILNRYQPRRGEPDRRGLEWRLLSHQLQEPKFVELTGHAGGVTEMAAFPDRERLASVGADGTLRIWNARTKRLLRRIELGETGLSSVAVSSDGRMVAAGGGKLHLCDLTAEAPAATIFMGSTGIESLAFAPGDAHLVAGMRYEECCVLTLAGEIRQRVKTAARVQSLEFMGREGSLLVPNRRADGSRHGTGVIEVWASDLTALLSEIRPHHDDRPYRLTLARPSPDGRLIAAGEEYASVALLLDASDHRLLARTPPGRDRLMDLAFSPDGQTLACGYRNGLVYLYSLVAEADGRFSFHGRSAVINAHRGEVTGLRFIDSATLATCGRDGAIRIWDLSRDVDERDLLSGARLEGLSVSPDGAFAAAVSDQECIILNVGTGRTSGRYSHAGAKLRTPIWAPSGNRIALTRIDVPAAMIIDETGKLTAMISLDEPPRAMAFTTDGAAVVVVDDSSLQIFGASEGREIARRPLTIKARGIAFSNDGTRLAIAARDGRSAILDASTWETLVELPHVSDAGCVAFSDDNSQLATGHGDSVVRLWKASTGALTAELAGHHRSVVHVGFSPDGRTLLTASRDGTVRAWSAPHRRCFGPIVQHRTSTAADDVMFIGMSKDARTIAFGASVDAQQKSGLAIWQLEQLTRDVN